MNQKIINKLKVVRDQLYEIKYLMNEEMEGQSSLLLELQEKKLPNAVDVEEELEYLHDTKNLIDSCIMQIEEVDIEDMEVYH